ncbi:unnamed protein product [Durusdinium trenchii]|uniref:PLOD1-3-like GT domain-containing protein n=1 Tax=Durusdinium trenchii TaxID=1381693 RepID=A0ABP0M3N2_9DINO
MFPWFLSLWISTPGAWAQSPAPSDAQSTRVHLVTYCNEAQSSMGFLLASAAANGLPTVVLGFGDHAWWPEGLGRKINALRRFVLDSALKPNDLVLFADAYDVLIQSTEQEIRESFERLERRLNVSLIFNGDRDCAPRLPDVCTDPRPVDVWLHPRVYLNSGAFIGRTFAMKSILLQDPVSDVMPGGDQAFYQRKFMSHPHAMSVDTDCQLLCTVARNLDAEGLRQLSNGTVVFSSAATSVSIPSILHFPGGGHWPMWQQGLPSSVIQEVFRKRFPEQFKVLYDHIEVSADLRGVHHFRKRRCGPSAAFVAKSCCTQMTSATLFSGTMKCARNCVCAFLG